MLKYQCVVQIFTATFSTARFTSAIDDHRWIEEENKDFFCRKEMPRGYTGG